MSINQSISVLPRHVGIIMDGNGRWAVKRGLPRRMGHQKGSDAFVKIARHAAKCGVEYLSVYAFSTENWLRPPEEVDAIMNLLRQFLGDYKKYRKDNMRMNILGNPAPLAPDIRELIDRIHTESRDNTGMTLNIAINYGGRDEILHAAKLLLQRYKNGEISDIDSIGEKDFEAGLYTAGMPDIDLVIRTSGELRISNFLLWQSAYAEYFFPDVLFPDFSPADFDKALEEYASRSRRMGGI